jgi:indolepyruvate ferredoxin oxidoreductase beta subunit
VKESFDILIAGVGGQGNLVCGQVISDAAVQQGYSPVIGQIFGASRRGGTVFTHVRLADGDVGPLIPEGGPNLILGLEALETLRASVKYGGEDTMVVFSQTRLDTLASLTGAANYPHLPDIVKLIEEICKDVIPVNAKQSLEEIGSSQTLNSYMIGVMIGLGITPLEKTQLERSINSLLGSRYPNLKAFQRGVSDTIEQNE